MHKNFPLKTAFSSYLLYIITITHCGFRNYAALEKHQLPLRERGKKMKEKQTKHFAFSTAESKRVTTHPTTTTSSVLSSSHTTAVTTTTKNNFSTFFYPLSFQQQASSSSSSTLRIMSLKVANKLDLQCAFLTRFWQNA